MCRAAVNRTTPRALRRVDQDRERKDIHPAVAGTAFLIHAHSIHWNIVGTKFLTRLGERDHFPRMDKKANLYDLRRQIDAISRDGQPFRDFRPFEPVATDYRLEPHGRVEAPAERGPFGRWLLRQTDREGWIGSLAKAAHADPGFPKDGDPEAVRARLRLAMAEGDMFEAVDDAELDWLSF